MAAPSLPNAAIFYVGIYSSVQISSKAFSILTVFLQKMGKLVYLTVLDAVYTTAYLLSDAFMSLDSSQIILTS